ncbi:MAG TPA: VOC family protein [Alphaproteobacteria bacterium]|nr:VOC family protein [Alphaproteobacteria bacterium]
MARPYAPLDHASIAVGDLASSAAFYDAALAPLGLARAKAAAHAIGYGPGHPVFWIIERGSKGRAKPGLGLHFCFGAQTRAAVDAFHSTALAHGGSDNGAPGLRPEYHPHYYGAFVLDPDGYKLGAVCHRAE